MLQMAKNLITHFYKLFILKYNALKSINNLASCYKLM
jgi:hypothetical protein